MNNFIFQTRINKIKTVKQIKIKSVKRLLTFFAAF